MVTPQALYDAHAGIAERIGGRHAARHPQHGDDLLQAARLGLWRACLDYDPSKTGGEFTPYAVQRVTWALLDGWRDLDHMKKRDRQAAKRGETPAVTLHAHSDWTDPVDPAPDPADAAAARVAAGEALWHVACLPEPMRDVFARYAINGEPLAQIAADYGRSEAWGYLQRRKAIKALRDRMDRPADERDTAA